MFKVKICGITTADDALLAAEAGADAIGLNFYERSPRFVPPGTAGEIVERLREEYPADRIAVFGVFVNAALDDILWTIREADLYSPEKGFGIQLHGDEPPDFVRALRMEGLGQTGDLFQILGHVPTIPVIRAFRCAGPTLEPQAAYLKQCQHLGALPQVVMLDACSPGSYGGTGECVDWQAVGREKSKLLGLPVILAGGLTPANVADAIKTAQPAGVDVASGVESAPGKKDAAKVMAFAAFAKQAFAAIDG